MGIWLSRCAGWGHFSTCSLARRPWGLPVCRGLPMPEGMERPLAASGSWPDLDMSAAAMRKLTGEAGAAWPERAIISGGSIGAVGIHFVPVRAAGAEEPFAGSIWAPRKEGVCDFAPGFLPSGDWPKTGGGGGALGSCGRACWGWSGVTGVTPQLVEGHGLCNRL